MSFKDNQLLRAIQVMTHWEMTQVGNGFTLSCSEATWNTFMEHPHLGPWLRERFPKCLKFIEKFKEERADQRANPFRMENNTIDTTNVMLMYLQNGTLFAEFVNWDTGASEILPVENVVLFDVGPGGTIYDFQQPSTHHIEPLFLSGKVPTYSHDLSIFMTRKLLEVKQSPVGMEAGKRQETLSAEFAKLRMA